MVLLHILWMILRFLLILLGIILGLVLLILLLVLFCPIRYRATAAKETESMKEITATASISWLFRGVRLIIDYRDGSINPDLRLFGISLMKVKAFLENRKVKKEQAAPEKKSNESEEIQTEKAASDRQAGEALEKRSEKAAEDQPVSHPKKAEKKEDPDKGSENKREKPSETGEGSKDSGVQTAHQRAKSPPEYGGSFAEEKEKALRGRTISQKTGTGAELPEEEDQSSVHEPLLFRLIEGLFGKIGSFFQTIQNLLKRVVTSVQSLLKKKDDLEKKIEGWKEFLSHPSIKPAVSLAWRKIKRLLKHIFPTKLAGDVAFGFEDPSTTGQILAIMGMTIPFHRNAVRIHPDFEGENHFEGTIWLKGRIYGIVFAVTAVRLLLDKHIRYIYRRLKNKEE